MINFFSILLLSHFALAIQNSSLVLNGDNRNFFQTCNEKFLTAVNNIFSLLKLNNNFTSQNKNWLLLNMHATLKSIAKRNYEAYEINSRSSNLHTNVEPLDDLMKLDKLLEVIVEEQLRLDKGTLNSTQRNVTGINPLTTLKIPKNWNDTLIDLKKYLDVVEDKNIVDDNFTSKNLKNQYKINKYKAKRWRNLKAWIPPNSTMINGNITRRLYHGKSAWIEDYPFLASIHLMGKFVCGGSIINRDLVITAASCMHAVLVNKTFLRDSPNGIQVRVGSSYTHKFGILCDIIKVIFHPKYKVDTLKNNLVILKIRKSLNFTGKKNKLRRINYKNVRTRATSTLRELMVLGWGDKDSHSIAIQDAMTFSYLDIYNHASCIDTYTSKFVYENNLCAGFIRRGSGACQRDVGGPGVKGAILVGVVSFGPPVCGTPDAPTVFTNLSYYIEWIDSIILRETPTASSLKQRPPHKVRTEESLLSVTYAPQVQRAIQNLKGPIELPRSQDPKETQDFQFLLNSILGNGTNIGEILYEADDSNESNKNIGFHELGPDISKQEKTQVQIQKEKEAKEFFKQVVNGLKTLANVSKHIKSKTVGQDPFFKAMKNLGSFLGIKNFVKADFVNPSTEKESRLEPENQDRYEVDSERFESYPKIFEEYGRITKTFIKEIKRNVDDEFEETSNLKVGNKNQPKTQNETVHISVTKHSTRLVSEENEELDTATFDHDASFEIPTTQWSLKQNKISRMLEESTIINKGENKYELKTKNLRERANKFLSKKFIREEKIVTHDASFDIPTTQRSFERNKISRTLGESTIVDKGENKYELANKFLSKNFVRDEKIVMSDREKSQSKELVELIALRITQSLTKNPSRPREIKADDYSNLQEKHTFSQSTQDLHVGPNKQAVQIQELSSKRAINPNANVVKALLIDKDDFSQREFLADSIRNGVFGDQILHSFSTVSTTTDEAPSSSDLPNDQQLKFSQSKGPHVSRGKQTSQVREPHAETVKELIHLTSPRTTYPKNIEISLSEFLADSIRKGIFGPQILNSFPTASIFDDDESSFYLPDDYDTTSKTITTFGDNIQTSPKRENVMVLADYDLENEDVDIESARQALDYVNI